MLLDPLLCDPDALVLHQPFRLAALPGRFDTLLLETRGKRLGIFGYLRCEPSDNCRLEQVYGVPDAIIVGSRSVM